MNFWYWLAIWWVFGAVVNQFQSYWYMGRLTMEDVVYDTMLGVWWPVLFLIALAQSESSILDKVLISRPKEF